MFVDVLAQASCLCVTLLSRDCYMFEGVKESHVYAHILVLVFISIRGGVQPGGSAW